MKHVQYVELHALAFIYSCMIGQVHLLVYYIATCRVLFRLSRALANRDENILGINFHECNLLTKFMDEIPGHTVYK